MLLRKLLRQAGPLELPPPHRPGEGAAVLQQLIGDRLPTCLTPEQVIVCRHQSVRESENLRHWDYACFMQQRAPSRQH